MTAKTMEKRKVLMVALLLKLLHICSSTSITEMDRLLTNLTSGYNKYIRPPTNTTETMYINISFFLMSVVDYDDVSGVLGITGGPMMSWTDPRLVWNPSDYSGIEEAILPRSQVWSPDLYVINPAEELKAIADDTFLLRFNYNGTVFLIMGDDIKILCPSDMALFPFDKQKCSIRVAAWGYFGHEVYLRSSLPTVDLTYFTVNNIWELDSTEAGQFEIGAYNGLTDFTLHLKRRPLYICVNMLAPIGLLAFLNPLVFLLPVESGERISYAVTIFLSIAVFMTLISENLPQSSSPMATISYFLFMVIIASALLIVITMLNLRLHLSNPSEKASKKLKFFVAILAFDFCRKCSRGKDRVKNIQEEKTELSLTIQKDIDTRQELAERVDRISFVYSIAFTTICWIAVMITYSQAP